LVTQEPHPEEAPIVNEIITRIAGGDSVSALLRDLNSRNGRHWARSSICRMVLEGVIYTGKRRFNGELLDGNWPAIVDEDVYWRAHAILSDPARKVAADRRGGIRPGRVKWMLSHIAVCAKCGADLSVTHRMRNGQEVPLYRCSSSCGGAMAPVEWMDWAVGEAIIRLVAGAAPGLYESIMLGDNRDGTLVRDQLAAERAKLDQFREQAIAGSISAPSFASIAAGIEARISELETELERLEHRRPTALSDLLVEGRAEENVRGCWNGMPILSRRRVVAAMVAPPGYLRLRPSGPNGRAHGDDAVFDPYRIEFRYCNDPRLESDND
jgi:hypothetical protein